MKVTLSLPEELLQAVDEYVAEHGPASRSGICASALREWIARRQEAEIEAYYSEISPEEQAEDDMWRHLASEAASKLWP